MNRITHFLCIGLGMTALGLLLGHAAGTAARSGTTLSSNEEAASDVIPLPVSPPIPATIDPSVTSFADDHPEFAPLTDGRIDTTQITFAHQAHLTPGKPKLQEKIAAWVSDLQSKGIADGDIPVDRLPDDQYRLRCSACHVPDVNGRYMEPIRFDDHCTQCHLGTMRIGERNARIPHGSATKEFLRSASVEIIAAGMAAAGAQDQSAQSPRSGPPGRGSGPPKSGPPKAGPPKSGPPKSGPPKSGPPRSGPPKSGPPKSGPPKSGPPRSGGASTGAATLGFNESVQRKFDKTTKRFLKNTCARCHESDELTDISRVVDPSIPDRWYPRSVFSHDAHAGFMDCVECHPQAVDPTAPDYSGVVSEYKWTGRTKDIMMPGIDSCRRCHAPDPVDFPTPVRHDCVSCHTYHAPSATASVGASH